MCYESLSSPLRPKETNDGSDTLPSRSLPSCAGYCQFLWTGGSQAAGFGNVRTQPCDSGQRGQPDRTRHGPGHAHADFSENPIDNYSEGDSHQSRLSPTSGARAIDRSLPRCFEERRVLTFPLRCRPREGARRAGEGVAASATETVDKNALAPEPEPLAVIGQTIGRAHPGKVGAAV
jgi:hypothetical protein